MNNQYLVGRKDRYLRIKLSISLGLKEDFPDLLTIDVFRGQMKEYYIFSNVIL